MSNSGPQPAPRAYKFTARSAEQAVALIREKLGPKARVVSVRPLPIPVWKKWLGAMQLEVIAQIDPAPTTRPSLSVVSAEPALPDVPAAALASRIVIPPTTGRTVEPGLAALLRRSGMTEASLSRLQSGAEWNALNQLPLHRALAETSRLLLRHAESRAVRAPLSRAAFLGTPGVGRTTALCKWISQEVFRRARSGHVVSVEFDRPNPLGPLPVFSEALGVPLAHFPCETEAAEPGAFVYFDLPGLSSRRPSDNAALAKWLDEERVKERVLVLNAAYDRASLRETYSAGRDLGATHLVFTHLDEVPQWGKLWDYLFDEQVEPLFLSTGGSLTGDFEEDVPAAIMRRTLPEGE